MGRIESIEKAGLGFGEVLVRPAVDFSSLEEVLVVLVPARPALTETEEPGKPAGK